MQHTTITPKQTTLTKNGLQCSVYKYKHRKQDTTHHHTLHSILTHYIDLCTDRDRNTELFYNLSTRQAAEDSLNILSESCFCYEISEAHTTCAQAVPEQPNPIQSPGLLIHMEAIRWSEMLEKKTPVQLQPGMCEPTMNQLASMMWNSHSLQHLLPRNHSQFSMCAWHEMLVRTLTWVNGWGWTRGAHASGTFRKQSPSLGGGSSCGMPRPSGCWSHPPCWRSAWSRKTRWWTKPSPADRNKINTAD